MIDRDLAELYEVETKYLKRQVQRNIERFNEEDFMFVLTKNEFEDLRCQIGTTSFARSRDLPYLFTIKFYLSSIDNYREEFQYDS